MKGKIIEFLWWAEKQGLSPETIRGYGSCLRALRSRGANLLDPESVKEVIAQRKALEPQQTQKRHKQLHQVSKLSRAFMGQA